MESSIKSWLSRSRSFQLKEIEGEQKVHLCGALSILRGDGGPGACDDITEVSIFGDDTGH